MKRVLTVLAVTATAAGTVLTVAPAANASPSVMRVASWPADDTGGLILRDAQGNDLGSGIGEQQDFELIECGPEGSGLIKVIQLRRGGGGGWGDLYEGYVRIEWTERPSMFDHCA